MIRYKHLKTRGITIPEILISAVIGTLLVGIVLGIWYFSYKNWTIERIRTRLRINLEIAMERIKEEMRLSSATYMSLYKRDAEYKAISFPMATEDADGFLLLDSDGKIYWDRSVIYHMYPNISTGNTELRRTEFTGNHDFLVDTIQREAQLTSVLDNGDGSSAPNGSNATTRIIFKNLVDLTIEPKSQEFDGYSSTTKRSNNIEFGSIKLTPGAHEFKFQVIGKNDNSIGYELGIDEIAITPSGCLREAETFTPSDSSGDAYSKVYAFGWGGNNYLEYHADAAGDYVSFQLNYDLWQESNFDDSIRSNTILTGNDLYVQLANPSQGSVTGWQAAAQAGSSGADFPSSLTDTTIRLLLSSANIDQDGDEIRVKFVAHSTSDLIISEAWIAPKSTSGDAYDGAGTPAQFLFSGLPAVTISAGGEMWSDWTEFSIDNANDYFVTLYISSASYAKYWQGPVGSTNSYSRPGNYAQSNDWTSTVDSPVSSSPDIYAGESAENWLSQGTVTSTIYDTKLSSATLPDYSTINWDFNKPAGTTIDVETRASDNSDMSGATSWATVTNGGVIPAGLDSKRYAQFRATLATSSPYTSFPSIDNVTIDWPGETKMCEISGYFTQKPNYGIIKLLVDGEELTKGFGFTVVVFEYLQGEKYEASLTSEIEPRNTAR